MILKNVHVENFRSVEDSGEFELGQVLCLVGKNEAGKTAVVQALAGLNPHPSTPVAYDLERDYPRRWLTEYETRHKGKQAVVVTTEWTLTAEEKAALAEQIGEKGLLDRPLKIFRQYGDAEPQWEFPINYQAAVEHLIENERLNASEKAPLGKATSSESCERHLKESESAPKNSKGFSTSSMVIRGRMCAGLWQPP
jgi:energy-coupling factor transporter ATP-binding protein EcfA2